MDNPFDSKDAPKVLSWQTINAVDEYLKSDAHDDTLRDKKPWNVSSAQGNIHAYNTKEVPKFAVDAFGRWKEIPKPKDSHNDYDSSNNVNHYGQSARDSKDGSRQSREQQYSSLSLRSVPGSSSMGSRNIVTPLNQNFKEFSNNSGKSTASTTSRGYKHLSMSLRSNVFPGVGKEIWESSTKKAYVPKQISTPDVSLETEFGIKKDSFMKWSEYDVYRQRLMKAWDKYITDMPKKEYTEPIKVEKKEQPKKPTPAKPVKKKTNNAKPKASKEDKKAENNPKPQEPQTTRIEVKPAPSEDGFWDFYEKPFAQ